MFHTMIIAASLFRRFATNGAPVVAFATATASAFSSLRRSNRKGPNRPQQVRSGLRLGLLALSLVLMLSACSSVSDNEPLVIDRVEAERTWQAARITVPDALDGTVIRSSTDALDDGTLTLVDPVPVAVWMHGCSGFYAGTWQRMQFLSELGFVVIAPDSLARSFYPVSCDTSSQRAGLYRPTLGLRQQDAAYALEQLDRYDWVDRQRVFLMGFSEGGTVSATFIDNEQRLRGRLIEGWVCQSDWAEYAGLQATPAEWVLALVAAADPWYQAAFYEGDCREFMPVNGVNESLVLTAPDLINRHSLLDTIAGQELARNFLLQALR